MWYVPAGQKDRFFKTVEEPAMMYGPENVNRWKSERRTSEDSE